MNLLIGKKYCGWGGNNYKRFQRESYRYYGVVYDTYESR
jgi:hypothetical protein